MDAFGRPNSSSDPPCERNSKGTIVQALHLMHAKTLHEKIIHKEGRVKKLADSKKTPYQIGEEIYLVAFGRMPTDQEKTIILKYFESNKEDREAAAQDLIWAVINSAEFLFNH